MANTFLICLQQNGSSSDLTCIKGYYQVPLSARAQNVSSFITPSRLYLYTAMSFGLQNAPASFQRLMNQVVAGMEGCAVYCT